MIRVLLILSFIHSLTFQIDDKIKLCTIDKNIEKYNESGRLPDFLIPTYYELFFSFEANSMVYDGKVFINVSIISRTNSIILHSDRISIKEIEVISYEYHHQYDFQRIKINELCTISKNQFLVIRLEKNLEKNFKATIRIIFSGSISEDLRGIYHTEHPIRKNKLKKIISTFFEPTYARLAFPCFDEPALKAIFKLSLHFPQYYQAVTSAQYIEKAKFSKMNYITYFETPNISTYQLGFALVDFKSTSIITESGIKVSVWLPEELIPYSIFSLNYAALVVEYFGKMWNYKYPFGKLDFVGILPFKTHIGTEHFSLISLPPMSLVIDESKSCLDDRQQALKAIGHLIAHQWFGNLVTMTWWNDLWLKEGFATALSFKAIMDIYPTYRSIDLLVYEIISYLYPIDQTTATAAVALQDPLIHTIQETYIHIPYYKGAAVLYHLCKISRTEIILNDMNKYLSKYQYIHANTNDLLKIIAENSEDENIIFMTKSLLFNEGIPVISIEKLDESGSFKFIQERFKEDINSRNDQKIWVIPIFYQTSFNKKSYTYFWLNNRSSEIKFEENVKWISLNSDFSNYYRVNYKSDLLSEIRKELNKNVDTFSNIDRMILLSDAFSMVSQGREPINYAFDFFEYLHKEKNFYVLAVFFDQMEYVKKLVYDDIQLRDLLKSYVSTFIRPIFETLRFNVFKDDFTRKLQVLAINKGISFGEKIIIDESSELFYLFLKYNKTFNNDLLPHLGCSYVIKNGQKAFDEIMDLYLKNINDSVSEIYFKSLLCVKDSESLSSLLKNVGNLVLPKFRILNHIISISQTPYGAPAAIKYVLGNYKVLYEIIHQDLAVLIRLIPPFMSSYKTYEDLNRFKTLFKETDMKSVETAISLGVKILEQNILWISKNSNDLKKYLSGINRTFKYL